MKKFYLIISLLTFLSCSKDGVIEAEPRVNCGEIVRLWSQNTPADEGNPCGDNNDYSRRFTFVVKNDITGNEKNFCINLSVYIRYQLGSIYCDNTNLDGW